jgi:hypothetical protein
MVHADHTYLDNPLTGIIAGAETRGAGVELRLYGSIPTRPKAAARAGGWTVLAGAMDKPHGLREAVLVDDEGYVWIPAVPCPAERLDPGNLASLYRARYGAASHNHPGSAPGRKPCARTNMKEIGHFIGGREVKGQSGRFGDIFNPNTGEVQAKVALASKQELRKAVRTPPPRSPAGRRRTPRCARA